MAKRVDNPFARGIYSGHRTYTVTADDRVRAVREFDRAQCLAALHVDDLQATVRRAIDQRLRALDRADRKIGP